MICFTLNPNFKKTIVGWGGVGGANLKTKKNFLVGRGVGGWG